MLKLALPCTLLAVILCDDGPPIAKIRNGSLRGKLLESRNGRKIYSFTGIPYAKPPLGELRFEPPAPADEWKGIKDATDIHTDCPQRNLFVRSKDITGDEDCLYLNVYTPKLSNDAILPVMVFFHGGGWFCGGGNTNWYSPRYLLDKDVVLVVPNYRLGPLGFLSTGDGVAPGNNALKDQTLALRWVRDNIESFGGDPNSVTIFGESAGGASVHYHLLSPLSRGLFHKAISESGTAFCNWAFSQDDQVLINTRKLAKAFDCPVDSSRELVDCLKKVDAKEIIAKDSIFTEWDVDPLIPFRPVVEPKSKGAFLDEDPEVILKSGRSARVPWITGINTDEGAIKAATLYGVSGLLSEFNEKFEKLAPIVLLYDRAKEREKITERIRDFYFSGRSIDNSTRKEVVNLFTDSLFLSGLDTSVRLHLAHGTQPVYVYLYAFRGAESFSAVFGDPHNDYGVCHADELMRLFPISFNPEAQPSGADDSVSELLIGLWTDFAATGEPTKDGKWSPASGENVEYYFISEPSGTEMREGLYSERTKFWRSLPLNYRRNKGIKDEL